LKGRVIQFSRPPDSGPMNDPAGMAFGRASYGRDAARSKES